MKIQRSKLLNGLEIAGYIYSPGHAHFHDPGLPIPMPVVDLNGSNVTLTVLSLNRARLTIRLLDSFVKVIPGFSGKVLIMDNASSSDQVAQLKDYLSSFPFATHLVEAERNYGVSGGRNKAVELIDTEWFISIDNDMLLVQDPLPAIKQTVDLLGVSFVNLPILQPDGSLISACGGDLWVQPYESGYLLSNASIYRPIPASQVDLKEPFLSTFLFGGASFINTREFIQHGCFDSEMFVGFEDLDFSIRLYQRGIKIATAPVFSLVHSRAEKSEADLDYQETRYSKEQNRASAEYLQRKYGFHVWSLWAENWIDERRQEPGTEKQPPSKTGRLTQSTDFGGQALPIGDNHPCIALVFDNPSDGMSGFYAPLLSSLEPFFKFDVFYTFDYDHVGVLLQDLGDYNLVHFFNPCSLHTLFSADAWATFERRQWNYTDFLENFVSGLTLTTQVGKLFTLPEIEAPDWEVLFSILVTGYAVTSKNMQAIYAESEIHPAPAALLEDAVDVAFFSPQHLERMTPNNRPLVIGWITGDLEGATMDSNLVRLLDELNAQGISVKGQAFEWKETGFSMDRLREFFGSIDVYLDLGEYPQRAMAAMACGLPLIIGPVGIDPELLGPLQSQFLIVGNNLQLIRNCLVRLSGEAELRASLSQENLERIRSRDWAVQLARWRVFLEQTMLAGKAPDRAASLEFRRLALRQQALIYSAYGEARAAQQRTLDELHNVKNAYETAASELLEIKWSRSYRVMVWLRQSPPGRLLASLARRTLALTHSYRK